ncbi:MAG: preprotein translocase subunit SecG [Candidatus Omnitrophota bacterium]
MFIFVLAIHILVALLLIVAILMQSGRGGGLTEMLSSMESVFGTKTNVFLVRTTTALAILFLITCLSLAYLSTQRGRSLIESQPAKKTETKASSLPTLESITEDEAEQVAQDSVAEVEEIVEQQPIQEEIESTEAPIQEE